MHRPQRTLEMGPPEVNRNASEERAGGGRSGRLQPISSQHLTVQSLTLGDSNRAPQKVFLPNRYFFFKHVYALLPAILVFTTVDCVLGWFSKQSELRT